MSPLHLWSYALFNLVFLHWFSDQVNLCASPLRAGFLFPVAFLDIFPIGLQNQVFWRLISLVQDLRVGVSDVLKSLIPQGKDPCLCGPSQLWIAEAEVWFSYLRLSYTSHCCPFISPFVVEVLFIQFSDPFLGELFHMWLYIYVCRRRSVHDLFMLPS